MKGPLNRTSQKTTNGSLVKKEKIMFVTSGLKKRFRDIIPSSREPASEDMVDGRRQTHNLPINTHFLQRCLGNSFIQSTLANQPRPEPSGVQNDEPTVNRTARPYRKKSMGSGSVTGGATSSPPNFNIKVKYSDCSLCGDGLEAVQVFWGTRRTDGVKVGKHTTVFPPLAATYDTFVDGGKESPGGAVYSGNHPYYMGRADLPSSYGYIPSQGSAGSFSGCTINVTDAPGAVLLHDEAYFETAIACLNYDGKGKDKLLESFRWGWKGKGTSYTTWPIGGKTSGLEKLSSPSAKFKETLKADYPGYSYV
jgi:hypothetical protein